MAAIICDYGGVMLLLGDDLSADSGEVFTRVFQL